MTLSMAAIDIINREGADIGEARHLRTVAETMAEDLPQLVRWAGGRMTVQNLLVAELAVLHPFELQTIATVLARAIAQRDPGRLDGRFSANVQKLADPFR